MRRWRDRQRRRAVVIPFEIDDAQVEQMLDRGTIDEAGSRDRQRLAQAAQAIFRNALADNDN